MSHAAWESLTEEQRHEILKEGLMRLPGCADSPEFLRFLSKIEPIPDEPGAVWYYTPLSLWERFKKWLSR